MCSLGSNHSVSCEVWQFETLLDRYQRNCIQLEMISHVRQHHTLHTSGITVYTLQSTSPQMMENIDIGMDRRQIDDTYYFLFMVIFSWQMNFQRALLLCGEFNHFITPTKLREFYPTILKASKAFTAKKLPCTGALLYSR